MQRYEKPTMFLEERSTQTDLEFSLQTTAASSRWGGVEFGQVGLQRGHLQLCVSVQVVL